MMKVITVCWNDLPLSVRLNLTVSDEWIESKYSLIEFLLRTEKCRINEEVTNLHSHDMNLTYLDFNESDYTMFLLRWS